MFASKTCTVESLSKDTVSITSLTALWNSVTLPSTWREIPHYITTLYQQAYVVTQLRLFRKNLFFIMIDMICKEALLEIS